MDGWGTCPFRGYVYVESNGLPGSDVFLKLPSLDLAGDVEL